MALQNHHYVIQWVHANQSNPEKCTQSAILLALFGWLFLISLMFNHLKIFPLCNWRKLAWFDSCNFITACSSFCFHFFFSSSFFCFFFLHSVKCDVKKNRALTVNRFDNGNAMWIEWVREAKTAITNIKKKLCALTYTNIYTSANHSVIGNEHSTMLWFTELLFKSFQFVSPGFWLATMKRVEYS